MKLLVYSSNNLTFGPPITRMRHRYDNTRKGNRTNIIMETFKHNVEWLWNDPVFDRHTVKFVVYDVVGTITSFERKIWIFNKG